MTIGPTSSSDLRLLDISLKHAGAIIASCMGDFSAPSQNELVLLRAGGVIELYRILQPQNTQDNEDDEEDQGTHLQLVSKLDTFSILRSLVTVRIGGDKRDTIVVGADGGCISVLDFEGGKGKILHCPAFGNTGLCIYIYTHKRFMLPFLLIIPFGSQKVVEEVHLDNILLLILKEELL